MIEASNETSSKLLEILPKINNKGPNRDTEESQARKADEASMMIIGTFQKVVRKRLRAVFPQQMSAKELELRVMAFIVREIFPKFGVRRDEDTGELLGFKSQFGTFNPIKPSELTSTILGPIPGLGKGGFAVEDVLTKRPPL